ncbi:DUF5753 domain-containing protein [Amycolatopsis sp. NPDC051758]|uniref:DUF5753 domain-containing protein n=1 Tax=Amycolatopsis sp. NPDC051758 TaxID=3363935 RepID=UPI0037A79E66
MLTNQTTPAAAEPWWNAHRGHYPDTLIAYFEAEARATATRQFQPSLISAALQEPEYAEAVVRHFSYRYPSELIDRTIAVRATRRAAFLRSGMREAAFVLDASVLRRPVGSDETMAKQHAWLRELDSSRRASIQIMDGVYDGLGSHFSIFVVAGTVVAFVDRGDELEQVEDTGTLNKLVERFERFRQQATPLRDCSLIKAEK